MYGKLWFAAALMGCCGCIYAQGSFTTPDGYHVTIAPYPGFPAYGAVAKDTMDNGKFFVATGQELDAPAGIAALYLAIDQPASTGTNYSGACRVSVAPRFKWTFKVTPPAGTTFETIYIPITFDWGQYTAADVAMSNDLISGFWSEASTSDLFGGPSTLANFNSVYLDPLRPFSFHVPTKNGSFSDRQVSASPEWRLRNVSEKSEIITVACTLQQDGDYTGASEVFYIPEQGALLGYSAYSQPVSTEQHYYHAEGFSLSAAGPMVVSAGKVTGAKGPAPVQLGLAGNYTIFADTGISTIAPAAITGNIGVGPGVTSTAITGFALTLPAGSAYSTSAQVNGKVYAFDYAAPTPANVTTASQDMGAAYADAAGRIHPNYLNLKSGNLAGLTLYPGLYTWGSGVTLPVGTDVTLSGGSNDVWIFQISGTLTTGANTHVFLTGGALAKNVFWQVAGTSVTLGANAEFEGIVLAKDAINFGSKAQETGRLLAQTAVNLNQNAVTEPSQ